MAAPESGDTLVAAALKVMLQPDPWLKAAYTQQAVQLWQTGAINRRVKSYPLQALSALSADRADRRHGHAGFARGQQQVLQLGT